MSMIERADTDIQRDVSETIGGVGLPIVVTVNAGVVTLEGIVLSEEEREAALDLVHYVPGVAEVVDSLEVIDMEDDQPNVLFGMPTRPDEWDATPEQFEGRSIPPEHVTTYDAGRTDDDWTTDERVAVEEGATYVPPMDPPIDLTGDPDGIEVAAGFQSSSMDDDAEMEIPSEEGDRIDVHDSEIVDNVVRELNEDSATTHLNIHVSSIRGTVFLTGYVSDPNDGDEAAAVAERVPGVRRVLERLVVGERPVAVRRPPIPRSANTRKGQVAVPSAAWQSTVARNERWLNAELEKVKGQIAERREELISFGRDQADEGSITNHQGDIASDVTVAETLNTEIVNLEDEVEAIQEVLHMMEAGTYGTCVVCGQLIDPARLRARPLAIRCIDCQQQFDDVADTSMQAGQRRGIG
jgi:DnaK suppressor protein